MSKPRRKYECNVTELHMAKVINGWLDHQEKGSLVECMSKTTDEDSIMKPSFGNTVCINEPVVLFDGVCKLCAFWSRFLLRVDRDEYFKLCLVQSPEGQAILKQLNMPTDHFDTMVVVDGGRCFVQSDAFLHVMRRLPFPWPLFAAAKIMPRLIRDGLYDRIAFNRYRLFGKYDACVMPLPEHEARFFRFDDGAPA